MDNKSRVGIWIFGVAAAGYSALLGLLTIVHLLTFYYGSSPLSTFREFSSYNYMLLGHYLGLLIGVLVPVFLGFGSLLILMLKRLGYKMFSIALSLQGLFYGAAHLYFFLRNQAIDSIQLTKEDHIRLMPVQEFFEATNFHFFYYIDRLLYEKLSFTEGLSWYYASRYTNFVVGFIILSMILYTLCFFARPKVKEQFR